MNPLVILSGGKDALLPRETFVTDLYIYIYIDIYTYIYIFFVFVFCFFFLLGGLPLYGVYDSFVD